MGGVDEKRVIFDDHAGRECSCELVVDFGAKGLILKSQGFARMGAIAV